MRATICVPDGLRQAVATLVEEEALPIELVSGGGGTVRVVQSADRAQSDSATLQAGGWITCSLARSMAAKLEMDGRKMGKLLDALDIRIRACELGCFD